MSEKDLRRFLASSGGRKTSNKEEAEFLALLRRLIREEVRKAVGKPTKDK